MKFASAKKVLGLRIPAADLSRWHRAAALEGCSMAEMCRSAIRDRVRMLEDHEARRRALEAAYSDEESA